MFFDYALKNTFNNTEYDKNTEYDPSSNSNLPFHVGDDVLNLLFLYDFLKIVFHV